MCTQRRLESSELFRPEEGMTSYGNLQAMQEAVRLLEWIIREIVNAGR